MAKKQEDNNVERTDDEKAEGSNFSLTEVREHK